MYFYKKLNPVHLSGEHSLGLQFPTKLAGRPFSDRKAYATSRPYFVVPDNKSNIDFVLPCAFNKKTTIIEYTVSYKAIQLSISLQFPTFNFKFIPHLPSTSSLSHSVVPRGNEIRGNIFLHFPLWQCSTRLPLRTDSGGGGGSFEVGLAKRGWGARGTWGRSWSEVLCWRGGWERGFVYET